MRLRDLREEMTMSHSVKQELFTTCLAPILNTAYGTALYITSDRDEADCLVQKASLRAYTEFSSFGPAACFKTWFLRLVIDLFRTHGRAGGGWSEPVSGDAVGPGIAGKLVDEEPAGNPFDPPGPFLRALSQQQITAAFSRLPMEERTVCALYFMDDLSYAEIAHVVGDRVALVRARLHRGRKALSLALRVEAQTAASPLGGR
jgi:RNA polymerase sigma-70 factor (ECF subfamily)